MRNDARRACAWSKTLLGVSPWRACSGAVKSRRRWDKLSEGDRAPGAVRTLRQAAGNILSQCRFSLRERMPLRGAKGKLGQHQGRSFSGGLLYEVSGRPRWGPAPPIQATGAGSAA